MGRPDVISNDQRADREDRCSTKLEPVPRWLHTRLSPTGSKAKELALCLGSENIVLPWLEAPFLIKPYTHPAHLCILYGHNKGRHYVPAFVMCVRFTVRN